MADGTDAPDERLVEIAHQMFDLARAGEAEQPEAYVEPGADPDTGTPTARETARMFGQDELFS